MDLMQGTLTLVLMAEVETWLARENFGRKLSLSGVEKLKKSNGYSFKFFSETNLDFLGKVLKPSQFRVLKELDKMFPLFIN